ncbi:ppiA [Symbiodinium sp. CCMP2456]|nr:ppiA [Symbiodinium sp. CCMP2456]
MSRSYYDNLGEAQDLDEACNGAEDSEEMSGGGVDRGCGDQARVAGLPEETGVGRSNDRDEFFGMDGQKMGSGWVEKEEIFVMIRPLEDGTFGFHELGHILLARDGSDAGSSYWGEVNETNAVWEEKSVHGYVTETEDSKGKVKVAGAGAENGEYKPAGKVSGSYPPVFRAKPQESYIEWKRSVEFWVGSEAGQLPPALIGPRMMVQLKDRAAQLVKHLTLEDVNYPGGMQKIFGVLEASPIIKQVERHRIDEHRRRLMQLSRAAGESMESYITRASVYRSHLLSIDATLAMGEAFYVGHLLDHAKLTRRDKAMIKTKAVHIGDEAAVTGAMMDLASELDGEPGFPIGFSEPNQARNGEEWLLQRGEARNPRPVTGQPGSRAARGVFAANAEVAQGGEESYFGHEDGEDSLEDTELPPEVLTLENEAFGTHFKARQKIAEVKKLRQYYRRPEASEDRKKLIQEKMKTHPCHACGQLGHWSRECPSPGPRAQAVLAAKSRPLPAVPEETATAGAEWALLASLCSDPKVADDVIQRASEPGARYMTHATLATVSAVLNEVCWSLSELVYKVILDIGCMRSVAGVNWANMLVARWKKEGRWLRVDPEREVFKFGDGEVLESRYRVSFLGSFGGKPVVYGFSIVDGVCPPLFSRAGCTQIGAVIDCEHHAVSARRVGVRSYGLGVDSGHYTMPVDECEDVQHALPDDFKLPAGCDIMPLCKGPHRTKDCPNILDSDDEGFSKVSTQSEMAVDAEEADRMARKKPQPRRMLEPKAAATSSGEQVIPELASALTPEEVQFLNKRRSKAAAAKSRAETKKALTGEQADYPSLSHVWANEVCLNLACSVRSRMRTFLWKKFVWQLRVKAAIEREQSKRWKRNPRWLAMLTGREVAALWGHLGSMRQKINSPTAGVTAGKQVIQQLSDLASQNGSWVLLEVFAGGATLTQVAGGQGSWRALAAVDIAGGWDLSCRETAKKLLALIDHERPDLVTLAPPCGPPLEPDVVEPLTHEGVLGQVLPEVLLGH